MTSKNINIETLLRELETNPPKDIDLVIHRDKIPKMDKSELVKLIFLQAETCIEHWGSEENPKYWGDTKKARDSYLSVLKSRPEEKADEFSTLDDTIVDPKKEQLHNLAVYHYSIIQDSFPKIGLKKFATGLDHYLKGRGKWERRLYKVTSPAGKVIGGISSVVGGLIKYGFVLVGIGVMAAGVHNIYTHWDSIKEYMPIEIEIVTDINEPNKPQRGVPEVNEPNAIRSIHDRFDRNLRTYEEDGILYGGVILKYGDCLSYIREYFGKQVDYDNIYRIVNGKPVKIPNDPEEHRKLPANKLICWPLPDQSKK